MKGWKLFQENKISESEIIQIKTHLKKIEYILQPITFLKGINLFYIKYHLYEWCNLCIIAKEKNEYLSTNIEFTENDKKNNVNSEDTIKRKVTNVQSVCPLYGHDKNNKIISKEYFKIYNKIGLAKYILINFGMIDEDVIEVDDRLDEERMCFNKRIKYNNGIIRFLI